MNQAMNKAFVINLDSKLECFQEVKEAFKPYGIESERFSAIRHEVRQVGASLSFLTLIEQARKKKAPWIMILEDDCVPRPAMSEWSSISKYLIKNKKHWDVFLGGTAYVYPRVLRNDFKGEEKTLLEIIECSHAVLSHFSIFNESSYDQLLGWHQLPALPEKRPVIDAFIPQCTKRIWTSSPHIVWQKVHNGTDLTGICLKAEEKLKHFSEQIRKSCKYRLLGHWMRTIS